ncbi:EamA family transporter [Undibacterium sp. TJN19]|uniref:EamA family transporter n=1 Tax=Undibacterium sp. TJN19 TaxID=3413055 RepID=UPI003BF33382
MCYQLLLCGVILLPLSLMADAPLPALSLTQILAYAYLSVVGALLAYSLWFRGIARLSPVAVSSLCLLSPINAVILGWIVLDQSLRGMSLAGLLIVLAIVIIVQKNMRSQV